MKIFQFDQEFYEIFQLNPNHPDQRCSFTMKTLFIVAGMVLLLISSVAFVLFEANSIDEYAFSFFSSTAIMVCTIQWLAVIWERPNLRELIENMEQFIEKRELELCT